jgi:hypothetical protein
LHDDHSPHFLDEKGPLANEIIDPTNAHGSGEQAAGANRPHGPSSFAQTKNRLKSAFRPTLKKALSAGVVFLSILISISAPGAEPPPPDDSLGTLILTNFVSAPFPHPDRAAGHVYQNETFSAAEHYNDGTVALFIPKDFRPEGKIDLVVHFHGWRNKVTNALSHYRLVQQFSASRRNAILIVPQGPLNAPDTFDGKLEDPGGFKRFVDEAMSILRSRIPAISQNADVGDIVLSGHSGGYGVISSIVARGGLTDHVREVWLFDALYGRTEKFVVWFDHHPGRFIDLYTAHGGTKDETESLIATLKENRVPFFSGKEAGATPSDLRNHLVFLFSELPHDEVMQTHDTFREFLETSALKEIGR